MKKLLRIVLVLVPGVAVVVVLGVNYATEHILPYSPIRPHRCTNEEIADYTSGVVNPAPFSSAWEEFDVTVEDTIRLKGWFVHAIGLPARGTIIILHGIGSCRIAMLPIARTCVQNGFNCILYDSRANGESGGLNCTFGYFEKRDVSAYIDSATVRYPGCAPFGIFGDSFGAAVAIQTMAIEPRIACGVAESPFASLREIIHDYFRQMFLVPLDFIPDAALKHSERIAGFSVDSVCPAADAHKILQPTMIVHGESDDKISSDHGRRVFDNLASPKKEWYLIAEAGHNNIAYVGGTDYQRRIVGFFATHLAPAKRNR